MDPPGLVSNVPLPEMWPFPLGVHPARHARMADQLGHNSAGFLAEMGGGPSVEESTVTEQSAGIRSRRKRRDPGAWAGAGAAGAVVSEDECSKLVSTCSVNDLTDYDVNHLEVMDSRDDNGDSKAEIEASSGICNNPANQPSEPPKQDYIHVRARRGQATDSHSLAERARREKISERMKILQDLVPGCNKIIGKSLVLDEIINYIQSLQRQVEFLSMKFEAVNSRVNSGVEGFQPKDFGIQTFDTAGLAFGSQATREFGQGSPPEWLHMQVGGGLKAQLNSDRFL